MTSASSLLLTGLIVLALTGCNSAEQSWLHDHGGTLAGARQERLDRLAANLTEPGREVRTCVLNSDTLAAFSWRSGHIFVARGLIDVLDDNELSAVLAHEMGHLVNDCHPRSVQSLEGHPPDSTTDIEADADRSGLQLLQQHHLPTRPMLTMLRKVRNDPRLSPTAREALQHRIQLLTHTN